MSQRAIKTETDLKQWVAFLEAQSLPVTVSCIKGVNRSNLQNALLHKWASQIGDELGSTMMQVKAQLKARYGLPIMKRDCPEWVAKWSPLYLPLPYEMKLQLFEIIPMTSDMTTKQLSEMMDAIQIEYRAQGMNLVDPMMQKYEGNGK